MSSVFSCLLVAVMLAVLIWACLIRPTNRGTEQNLRCSCGHGVGLHVLADVPGQDEPCSACRCAHWSPAVDVRAAVDTPVPYRVVESMDDRITQADVDDEFMRIVGGAA